VELLARRPDSVHARPPRRHGMPGHDVVGEPARLDDRPTAKPM
jgi:hypothetical protein